MSDDLMDLVSLVAFVVGVLLIVGGLIYHVVVELDHRG